MPCSSSYNVMQTDSDAGNCSSATELGYGGGGRYYVVLYFAEDRIKSP